MGGCRDGDLSQSRHVGGCIYFAWDWHGEIMTLTWSNMYMWVRSWEEAHSWLDLGCEPRYTTDMRSSSRSSARMYQQSDSVGQRAEGGVLAKYLGTCMVRFLVGLWQTEPSFHSIVICGIYVDSWQDQSCKWNVRNVGVASWEIPIFYHVVTWNTHIYSPKTPQRVLSSPSNLDQLPQEPLQASRKSHRTNDPFIFNMTSFKACILLLVAAAATEAVWFANQEHDEYHVPAAECTNFPTWLNDKAVWYKIDKPWRCDAFADYNCGGYSIKIAPTNGWQAVPMAGISSTQCY